MHQGKSIKSLRFDRRGEYLLGEFRQFLKDYGLAFQKSKPCLLKQEGVAKEGIRIFLDMIRSLMSYVCLPDSFWEYALVIG